MTNEILKRNREVKTLLEQIKELKPTFENPVEIVNGVGDIEKVVGIYGDRYCCITNQDQINTYYTIHIDENSKLHKPEPNIITLYEYVDRSRWYSHSLECPDFSIKEMVKSSVGNYKEARTGRTVQFNVDEFRVIQEGE